MTSTESEGRPTTPAGDRLGPTLFERSRPGRGGGKVPHPPKDALARIPADLLRAEGPRLPEVSEPELTRHYVNLSKLNYSVDSGFYPLGSCAGFSTLHPFAPDDLAQGTLQLLWELETALAEIGGMKAVTLQPAAGAQGELTGILMVRAYHRSRGDTDRSEVLVPDSAHGTNPATASMAGFRTVSIPSAPDGGVDVEAFRSALGPRTAAVMITNPSTLGLFESRLCELLDAIHEAGALAYMDGANLNAIMGRFKPGDAGFDVMHFNTHKTFSTPHGGGGPGAGPVGVGGTLLPFLPSPRVLREPDGRFRLEAAGERPTGIGRVRAFVGNAGILVRAYVYIRAHGDSGLREVSDDAVLAANYLKSRLAGVVDVPFSRPCMHEFVASSASLKAETGIRTLDVAKRLIDYGFHPPTIYFPLTVEEALLIEPTETESLETLDAFVEAMARIVEEAHSSPDLLHSAPHYSPVRRLDETTAARQPNLRWRAMTGSQTPCPD
jgi:glycine dehydrogenase subunit 2